MNEISLDKKYVTRSGNQVRLYCIDGGGNFPVHGAIFVDTRELWEPHTWTINGKYCSPNLIDYLDLIEYDKINDLKIDDKVLVRTCDTHPWEKRYFAGVEKDTGKILTFQYGTTSWTKTNDPVAWNYWKLPE